MDREDLSAGTPRPDPNAKAKHQSNILNKRPAGGGRGGREKKVVRPLSDSARGVAGGEGPSDRERPRGLWSWAGGDRPDPVKYRDAENM